MKQLLLFLLLFLFPLPTMARESQGPDLGTVHFPISCSPEVQGDFNRAVALLHHMMYLEARKSFEEIARKDQKCPMAGWGIAMTLFQPLWPARPGAEELKRGWMEVQKAIDLGPATERERDFVAAAEAFYREPETADWWTRIGRWAAAMEAAYRERPEDIETAAFYALSQLAAGYVEEDRMAYNARAAKVLLHIYERAPTHPGAIHYTIHANDVEGRANESLEIVRSYSDIAPSVPHALHMPSHIFLRLGEWPEVIEWNRKSTAAALRISPAEPLQCAHYPHAPAYLLYAYLQRGEDAEARAVLEDVLEEVPSRESHAQGFVCAFHLAEMPARYAVERRAWTEAAALHPRTPVFLDWDRYPWAEALTWFARGLGALRSGDLPAAREAEGRMRELRERATELGEPTWVRYIEIDRRILAGRLAAADGDAGGAVALIRSATELDRTVEKDPVTPGALMPPYEALGDLLLELNQPAEALAAYEQSLRLWPRRFNSLLGAARAAADTGQVTVAKGYYMELLKIVGEGTTRPGVQEARAFLAGP
jgi:tetratricopeptide (TPR) repeat protein